MKKVFCAFWVFCCVMLLILPGVAFSAAGPYVSGNFGVGFLTDSTWSDSSGSLTVESDPGFALGVAAGYNFGMFRLEGEIGYQKNDLDKVSVGPVSVSASGDVTNTYFLGNGYFDFINSSPFTPYVSTGIGFAKLKGNDFAVLGTRIGDSDDTVFAYQAGVGIGYAVNNNITIDLKYRYFRTADPNFNGTDGEYATHNIYLGLRYNF